MLKQLVLVVFALGTVLALTQAGRLDIQRCSRNNQSLASEVALSSPNFTDGTAEALLRRGQSYQLVLSFIAATNASRFDVVVSARIAGVDAPWQGINPNPCPNLTNGTCPFVPGQYYEYTNTIAVLPDYPTVTLTILWRFVLQMDSTANEICFELPARIQA